MVAIQIGASMCVIAATGYFVCSTLDNATGYTTRLTQSVGLASVALGLTGIVTAALGAIWS